MSASDFNILIGVDMSNAESEIKESIKNIGKNYPLELKAVITNESDVFKFVEKLIKNLVTLDVNLGLGDEVKELKKVEKVMGDISKTDLGKGIKEAEKSVDSLTRSYEKLLKVTEKLTAESKKDTVKTGTPFLNKTTVSENNKTTSKETVQDYKAFNDYIDKVEKKISGYDGKRVDEIREKISSMRTLFENKDFNGFASALKDVNRLVEEHQKERKAIELKGKESVKWEKIANDVKREGMANYQSIAKLQRLVNKLSSDEVQTLEQVQDVLKQIEQQYHKINLQQKDTKFGRKRTNEVENLRKKVGKNIDENLVGKEDFSKLHNEINKIFEADSVLKLENAVKRVIKLYEELLDKQMRVIEQKKLEVKAIEEQQKLQEYLKRMETEKANLEHEERAREYTRQQNTQKVNDKQSQISQMKKQMVESGLISPSSFDEVEQKLRNLGSLAQSSFVENLDIEKGLKDIDKLVENIDKQYQQMLDRQNRLVQSTNKWQQEINQIVNSGFVNASEFAQVQKLIDNLTIESDNFEKELKEIERQIKKINTLSNQRKTKQDNISVTQYQNINKANDMAQRGIVPQSMIDDFKAMNDMLDFTSTKQDIAVVNRMFQELVQLEEEIKKAGREEAKIRELIADTQMKIVKATDKYNDTLNEIVHNTNRQISDAQRRNQVEQEATRIQQLVNQLKQNGVELSYDEHRAIQQEIVALKRLAQAHRDVEAEEEARQRKIQQINDRFDSNAYRAKRGLPERSREYEEVKNFADEIEKKVRGLGQLTGDEFKEAVKEIEQEMTKLNRLSNELRDRSREFDKSIIGQFENAIQKVPIWVSAMTLVYGTMHQIQQGFQYLLDVDKAMTDLQKVTEASHEELEAFKQTASSMGKELGVLSTEVIQATAEFQKLGYTLEQSAILGQNSILYANVGDMSIQDASNNIISTIKGFGIEVDKEGHNIRRIVDMFNEVGNNFAISSEGIGEALKRSSAVLREAGNSIEQSIALVTAANTTIQDPDKVGTALKTISMRLRGVNEEGKIAATLVPEIEKTFQRLNVQLGLTEKNKLTLLEDDGKTFKSTYKIMEDIAKVWNKLSDIEQANLVELIGGKEQGSIVSAMIQNWKDAVGAYETALNSAGSAQREFNAYMDSFEYKIGQLKNAVEHFWVTLADDRAIKNLIDAFTALIESLTWLIETFGSGTFTSIILAVFSLFSSKKVRDIVLLGESVKTLGSLFENWTGKLLTFGKAFGRFLGLIGVFITIAQVAGLAVDALFGSEERRQKQIKSIEDEITKLEELKNAYDKLDENGGVNRYVELEAKGNNRTLEEESEYLKIQQQIKEEMPQLIAYYDEYGKAVLKSAGEIRKLRDETEQLLTQKKREVFDLKLEDADFGDLEDNISKVKQLQDVMKASQKSLDIQGIVKEFVENDLAGLDRTSDQWIEKMKELSAKINKELSTLTEQQKAHIMFDTNDIFRILQVSQNPQEILKDIDQITNITKQRMVNLQKALDDSRKNVKGSMDNFNAMLDEQFALVLSEKGIKTDSNQFKLAEELKNVISDNITNLEGDLPDIIKRIPELIDKTFNEVQSQGISIDKLMRFDGTATQEMVNSINNAISNLKTKGTADAQVLIQMLEALKQKHLEVIKQMDTQVPSFTFVGNVLPVVENYVNAIKDLDSAYRQLSNGQELSLANVMELLGKYPQLTKYLESHNGVLRLSANAIKELAKIKEEEFKNDLRMKKEEAENAKRKSEAVIQAILAEAKATQLLADIKSKGVQQTVDELKQYRFMANKMGETELANQYTKQIDAVNRTGEQLKNIAQIDEEIKNIEKLLNQDWTSQLGKITSSPSKEKQKKELQDAIYVADKFKKRMDELNLAIAKQQSLQKEYAKFSDGYRNALAAEIKLHKEKKQAIENEIASLQKQVNNKNIQKKGLITLSKDDNKTARAKQAELQQEIDQTIARINELKQEAVSVNETITNLKWNYIESNIELFEIQREMVTDDIAYQEYAMSLYDEASENYRKHARVKLQFLQEQMKYHKQELDFLEREKEANKNLTNQQIAELNHLIREKRQAIYDMAKTIDEINDAIINSYFEEKMFKFASENEKYAKKIREIEDKIKYDIDEDDYAEHISYLKEIVGLRKGEINDIKKTISELYAMKERHKDNLEMVEKIKEQIKEWEEKLVDAESAVKDVSKRIKDVYEKLADQYVELYKEQLELMKKAEEDAYKDMMDAEKKRHEQRMKNIDREMKILQDAYDKQMELIDREEAKHDYERNVDKMEDEIKYLREQINILSLDDSYEAKAKKAELVKELTEKEMELAEMKHDREVELRKENIEDDYDAEREKLERRKDAYEEDYQNFVDTQEKKWEERLKYWEAELENEKKFAELRQEVLDGNFESMLETVQEWADNVSDHMENLGETVTENFTYKVEQAIEKLRELRSMGIPSFGKVVGSTDPIDLEGDDMEHVEPPKNQEPNYSELTPKEADIVRKMKENSQKWLQTTNQAERDKLHQKNVELSKGIKGVSYSNGTWYKNGKPLYSLLRFNTGGYTGDWSGNEGKLAILDKKELVLNEEQTKHILDTAKVVEKLKGIIPNLNVLQNLKSLTRNEPVATTPTEINEYNITVKIENMNGDKKSADLVADQIVNKIKRTKGGRF
jgi:TP901 family phage tail tape measure protein